MDWRSTLDAHTRSHGEAEAAKDVTRAHVAFDALGFLACRLPGVPGVPGVPRVRRSREFRAGRAKLARMAHATGRSSNVSTSAGAPTRDSPMSAPSRAMSVDRSSGDGSVRVRSAPWAIRPGTTPASTSTMSMPAGGGCDSRSSRMSVRSTRASRIGAGRCSTRTCDSRVTSCSRVVTSTAPRSARSSATDNGSSTRASTNDNGSSPSIGQSSTQRSTNLGASSAGTSQAVSSPRAA